MILRSATNEELNALILWIKDKEREFWATHSPLDY
jgi:hypothetical protein